MKIPLVDIQSQYQSIKPQIQSAINAVLENGDFILGSAIEEFEKEFAKQSGVEHCVSCASGTDALLLILKALNIGPGDEVITVAYTWASTAFAVSEVGAKPVFVDIDPVTYCMDPALIEKAITKKTKAILPVHLYGQPADMDAIVKIAKKHKLLIIEDACQSHLSTWNGKSLGTFGAAAAYSFYPGKNLGAYGDAGAVVTQNPKLAEKIRILRHIGQAVRNTHLAVGINSRMDTLQAAILNVKLKHLKSWTQKRREAAARYARLLKGLDCQLPVEHKNAKHVWHVYAIQVNRRDEVIGELHQKGVMAQIHYPTPLHFQPCYKNLGKKKGDFPVSEKTCSRILSLPMYAEITEDQQRYVARCLSEIL